MFELASRCTEFIVGISMVRDLCMRIKRWCRALNHIVKTLFTKNDMLGSSKSKLSKILWKKKKIIISFEYLVLFYYKCSFFCKQIYTSFEYICLSFFWHLFTNLISIILFIVYLANSFFARNPRCHLAHVIFHQTHRNIKRNLYKHRPYTNQNTNMPLYSIVEHNREIEPEQNEPNESTRHPTSDFTIIIIVIIKISWQPAEYEPQFITCEVIMKTANEICSQLERSRSFLIVFGVNESCNATDKTIYRFNCTIF